MAPSHANGPLNVQESPADAAEVQKLMRRMRGMVRVCVVTGKQLRGLGMLEDAVVELTTDTEYYEVLWAGECPEDEWGGDGGRGLGEALYGNPMLYHRAGSTACAYLKSYQSYVTPTLPPWPGPNPIRSAPTPAPL